jgi:7-cyano-7-deazaguanine synthase
MRAHKKKSKKVGVLYSGGLDSSVLIEDLLSQGYEVWPVYVHCGLPWEQTEIYWAKRFLKALRHPRLQPLNFARLLLENAYAKNWSKTGKTPGAKSPDAAVFLPARNILLIIKTILVLTTKQVHQLALATLKGNPFADARPHYFRSLERILSASFKQPVQILTPFRRQTKIALIKKHKKSPLQLTFSCINSKGIYHCGKCNKCAERRRAFKVAGIEDRTTYKITRSS